MAKSIDGKLLTPSVATESVLNLLHKKIYLMYDLVSDHISEEDHVTAKTIFMVRIKNGFENGSFSGKCKGHLTLLLWRKSLTLMPLVWRKWQKYQICLARLSYVIKNQTIWKHKSEFP